MPRVVMGSDGSLSRALATGLDAVAVGLGAPPEGTDGAVIILDINIDEVCQPVSIVSDVQWRRLAEEPMRRALEALQRSRLSMHRRGGAIVLVAPTLGIAGAAGLVPLTTAAEGVRAMAKSAARQWASEGILVNTIAVPVGLFEPALATSDGHLSAPAVPVDEALIDSVIETTEFLLERKPKHLIGQTIVIDGGSVMLP